MLLAVSTPASTLVVPVGRLAPAVGSAGRRQGGGWPARWLAACGLGLVVALLAGCGGGGPAAEPPRVPPVQMTGVVTDALDPPPRSLEVQAKGRVGLSRTTVNVQSGTDYAVVLTDLQGPYLLGSALTDGAFVYALATEPGHTNLTPLTTLVVAQAMAQDPDGYFESLGHSGGVPDLSAAALQQAQEQVAYHLHRQLGLDWRGSPSFMTTPFRPEAADAHFERLRLLQATLAGQGRTLKDLVAEVSLQAQRCQGEHLVLTQGEASRRFCPSNRSSRLDEGDGTVQIYEFADVLGDELTVRARGETVLSATWQSEGNPAGCDGEACAGLSLGAANDQGERPITWAAVALTDAAGLQTTLAGSLTAAMPGRNFPPLPCESNRVYLIPGGGPIVGFCSQDDEGLPDASHLSGGRLRDKYLVNDSASAVKTQLEVTAEGQTVISVVLFERVGVEDRVSHRCLGAACAGVVISLPGADGFRRIQLTDTELPAVDASGQPSGGPAWQVRADFQVEMEPLDWDESYCQFDNGEVRGTFNDETEPMRLCVPTLEFEDETGFYGLVNQGSDGPGQIHYQATSMYGRYAKGDFNGGIEHRVRVNTEAGQVVSVVFTRYGGTVFRCDGAACTGVTVTPATARRGARIRFDGSTTLVERLRGNLPGDRSLVLSGSYSTPRPP